MNSIKNTFVAVLLLGASYGVYQAITTPDTTVPTDADMFARARLDDPGNDLQQSFNSFPSVPSAPGAADQLPPKPIEAQSPPLSQRQTPPRDRAANSFPGTIPDNSFQPPQRSLGNDNSVRQATGNGFEPKANPIGVADSNKPHDHALISALKQVARDTDTFAPPTQRAADFNKQRLASTDETATKIDDFDFMAKSKNLSTEDLIALWPRIEQLTDSGDFRTALGLLSRYYYSDNIVGPQRQKLMGWLNALSGKVIYSSEHHFQGRSYTVRPNDTLEQLAANWKIPAGLIYNINRKSIPDPTQLVPGTELKIVVGPFNAELDKSDQTLTLFVKRMYAGQFNVKVAPISLGNGISKVSNKTSNVNSSNIGPSGSQIELANGIKFVVGETASQGAATLNAREMQDLFVILSEESHIRIRD